MTPSTLVAAQIALPSLLMLVLAAVAYWSAS